MLHLQLLVPVHYSINLKLIDVFCQLQSILTVRDLIVSLHGELTPARTTHEKSSDNRRSARSERDLIYGDIIVRDYQTTEREVAVECEISLHNHDPITANRPG